MFEEILKLSFVETQAMFIVTFTILHIFFPITLIEMTFRRFPFAKPTLHSTLPVSDESFPIMPFELALSRSQPIFKSSNIDSIHIFFVSQHFFIIFKVSLE